MTALLCFGLSDDDAIGFGWWVEAELSELKGKACIDRRSVGKLIGMTTDVLVEHELWHLGLPIDQTAEEYAKWKKERSNKLAAARKQEQRKNERERKQAERAEKERRLTKAKAETNPRHAAILTMLAGGALSVAELVKRASKTHAFLKWSCRNTTWVNGPPRHASVANLRDAIHETLNQLEAKGAIVTFKVPGKRGPQRKAAGLAGASEGSVGASGTSTAGKPNDCSGFSENDPCHAVGKSQRRDMVFPTPSQQAEMPKTLARKNVDYKQEQREAA